MTKTTRPAPRTLPLAALNAVTGGVDYYLGYLELQLSMQSTSLDVTDLMKPTSETQTNTISNLR